MYDFRDDLSKIVKNVELTKEGLEAIKAAVNLSEHSSINNGFGGKHSHPTYKNAEVVDLESAYLKTKSNDLDISSSMDSLELDEEPNTEPDKPSLNSNYDELTDEAYYGEDDSWTSALLTNVSVDSTNSNNIKSEGHKTPQETIEPIDNQFIDSEKKHAENANMKPAGNGMTLTQHNAVQKYKSINEQLYNEIRNWINNADNKPDFTALHYALENHRNSIHADDLDQTDAYYLILSQTFSYAQKLFNLYEEKTADQQNEIDSLFKQTDVLVKGFLNYLNGDKQSEFISALSDARKEQNSSLLSEATLAIMNNYIEEDTDNLSDNESNQDNVSLEEFLGESISENVSDNLHDNESNQDKGDIVKEFFGESFSKKEANDNAVNKGFDDSSKIFDLKHKEYVVKRRLSGAQLMDKNGQQAFYVNETQVHALNLQTGDIVKADGHPYQQDDNGFKLKKVVGHLDGVTDNPRIIEFKQAVVEKIDGNLVVRRNINGKPLTVNGKPVEYLTDNSKLQSELDDGSIVDLAWYDLRSMPNPQRSIAVRWIYPTETETSEKPSTKSSHGNRKKYKGIKKHNEKKSANKDKSHREDVSNRFQEMLNLIEQSTGESAKIDLKGLNVGIAIGGGQNWETIKNAIILLNGKPRLINAFSGKRKTIHKIVKGLDVVVLVQSYANHASSWQISDACKEYGVKFAISQKLAVQSILQAIYRAIDNQPVFMPSGQVIDYTKGNSQTEESSDK